jgi:hypothetical protein
MKLKWKVSASPTGEYRSFQHRSWPTAEVIGVTVAQILCDDDYTPARSRSEDRHGELTVMVANRNECPWKWRRMKARFTTLSDAKAATQQFFDAHLEWLPKEAA